MKNSCRLWEFADLQSVKKGFRIMVKEFSNMKRHTQSGFTLCELMVVVFFLTLASIASDALLSQTFFNADKTFATIDNAKMDALAQNLQSNGSLEFGYP